MLGIMTLINIILLVIGTITSSKIIAVMIAINGGIMIISTIIDIYNYYK